MTGQKNFFCTLIKQNRDKSSRKIKYHTIEYICIYIKYVCEDDVSLFTLMIKLRIYIKINYSFQVSSNRLTSSVFDCDCICWDFGLFADGGVTRSYRKFISLFKS